MEKEKKRKNILNCVQIEHKNPYKLNEEGKRNLAHDIIEEISIEELINFLRKNGYQE